MGMFDLEEFWVAQVTPISINCNSTQSFLILKSNQVQTKREIEGLSEEVIDQSVR